MLIPVFAEAPRLVLAALATVWLAASLHVLLVSGPAAGALAEQQMLEGIAVENRAFCEEFGMPAGTREHGLCHEALMEIRALHDRRRAAETQSLL